MGLRRPRPGKQMSLTTSEQQQLPADDGMSVLAMSVEMTAEFRYLLLQCTGCEPVASDSLSRMVCLCMICMFECTLKQVLM